MMDKFKLSTLRWIKYFKFFFKWLIAAIVIGITLGFVGVGFHYAIELVSNLRERYDWLILCLPIAGILIVVIYHLLGVHNDKGANAVLESTISGEPIKTRMSILIFIGTVLTHLCGGSVGREGAALQLGGSIAGGLSRTLKLNHAYTRILTMCGMAAAFSALFGTPVTAAVFAVGIASAETIQYAALMPCMVSSLCGYFVSGLFGVIPVHFILQGSPAVDVVPILQVLLMGILCGWLSVVFCSTLKFSHNFSEKHIKNDYYRIIVGGMIIVALTYLMKTRDYNGTGMNVIERAISGEAKPEAFIIKLIFTVITVGVGFKGGEIVPSFFIGSTFGCVVGGLIGLNPAFGAALGLVATFCGATNCVITSIILSVELFGAAGLPYFALVACVSYLLSGYISLYGSQKILLSKWDVSDLKIEK